MALSAASRFDLLGNRRFHSKLTHFRVSLPGKRSKCTTWIKNQDWSSVKYWGLWHIATIGRSRFVQMTRPLAFTPLLFLLLSKPCGIAMRLGGASLPSIWSTGEWVNGSIFKSTSHFFYASWTNLEGVTHLGTLKMDWIAFELSNLSREEGVPTTGSLNHQCDNSSSVLPYLLDRSSMSAIAKDGLGLYDCPKIADFLRCSYIWFCVQSTKFPDVCKSWPGHV